MTVADISFLKDAESQMAIRSN